MDVTAKLAKKNVIMRNKKQYRNQIHEEQSQPVPSEGSAIHTSTSICPTVDCDTLHKTPENLLEDYENSIQYVQTVIEDGNLSTVLSHLPQLCNASDPNLMVISLHSCGNLLHHGLRSLTLNPSVHAVALVGCCYNLLTERLLRIPNQQPTLRTPNPRLQQTSSTCDPHGFPMSERFLKYKHRHGSGIRFNITARMMAVQAPQNWTEKECNSFFTRHFFRALFQRILVDRGVVEGSRHEEDIICNHDPIQNKEPGYDQPIILGSLRKQCYTSFTAYVRAAITKLQNDPVHAEKITHRMAGLTDQEIQQYERDFAHKKKELSIVWSLMAFSAGVVESAIVVDRWQWLREQKEVKECWVESIFDYSISPRNLVVVGVKG
ncbi:MAG: hypothetical protein Q9219_004579 [cf. Caloplaca sp. 3 TL-2023]